MANIARDQFHRLFGGRETAACVEQEEYAGEFDRGVILALALALAPRKMLEIGVQRGRTARLLLAHLPSIERYVGVDVPADFAPANAGQLAEVPEKAGDLVSDERFEALELARGSGELPRRKAGKEMYDLVYIDGSHAPEDVRADTEWALEHTAPGGAIVWHDYVSEPGVQAVIDQWNEANGNRIHLVDGTWVCFLLVSSAK